MTKLTDPTLNKLPPHDATAEIWVLGAIFLAPKQFYKAVEIVTPDDFFDPANRYIFKAMSDISERLETIDLVTVQAELSRSGKLEAAGGTAYLASLIDTVITAENIITHAKIVKEKSVVRGLISSYSELLEDLYSDSYTAQELTEKAQAIAIKEPGDSGDNYTFEQICGEVWKDIEDCYDKKIEVHQEHTGFETIDRHIEGFSPGDYIIIAARPSIGKSTLALNIAENIARTGHPVGIFSLEMHRKKLAYKAILSGSGINSRNFRVGNIKTDQLRLLASAYKKINKLAIIINDISNLSPEGFRNRVKRLKLEHGIKLVILDYIHLLNSKSRENQTNRIGEISRMIKLTAMESEVPIIGISQLNRKVEEREEKIPCLSDLRDSGNLEQDADIVLFIHRPEFYEKDDPENPDKVELVKIKIAKNRMGRVGIVDIGFSRKHVRFVNLEGSYAE